MRREEPGREGKKSRRERERERPEGAGLRGLFDDTTVAT